MTLLILYTRIAAFILSFAEKWLQNATQPRCQIICNLVSRMVRLELEESLGWDFEVKLR